jgi:hypothetical protein
MWVGLHRINNDGAITFYCANDLNHPSTEREVKHVISQNTPREFYPMSTIWISCKTPNFSPHSNECGPCTILALAVLSQHPNPHAGALCPYLHSHLAQVCHEWMGMIILTGKVHLLPPSLEATVQSIPMCTIHYTPKSTISWAGPQPPFLTPSHSHTLSISTKKFIRRTHLSMDVKETPTTGKKKQYLAMVDVTVYKHIPFLLYPIIPIRHMHISPKTSEDGISHKEISNMPKRTVKQSTIQNSLNSATIHQTAHRKKIIHPPTQRTLTESLQIRRSNGAHDGIWGHTLHETDRSQTFRIALQNPQSLRLFTDSISTQCSFLVCQSLAVGALCLPGTNVNWDHKEAHTKLQHLCKKAWNHSSFSTSLTQEDFKGTNQPGGTSTIILDSWTSRVVNKGTNPFGLVRGSYITI